MFRVSSSRLALEFTQKTVPRRTELSWAASLDGCRLSLAGTGDASVAGSEDQPFPETKDYCEVAREYRSLTLASMGREGWQVRTQDSGIRRRHRQRPINRLQVTTLGLPTSESITLLDVGEFSFFRLGQFVDFTDVGVSKFLHLVETVALIIFRDFFVFQHFL